MCGDVESNPGPDSDMKELIEGQKAILDEIAELRRGQTTIDRKLSSFESRLTTIENKVDLLNETARQLAQAENKITKLAETVSFLTHKIDDLENRSRRNNVIIYGIKEEQRESSESLRDIVTDTVFKDKLGISVTGIERCHRLGKKGGERPRPVILKLLDYREKVSIFHNARKLKGSDISISDDYSSHVQELRKKLWASSADDRAANKKVKLSFDKLIIGDKVYRWDESKEERVHLRSRDVQ